MTFEELRLIPPLLRAVRAEGYTHPTPIQREAIPHVLDGKDLLGCAQTGTGKTAAFALPILQRLDMNRAPAPQGGRGIRVLVLSPTRELAAQIGESFAAYGRHLGFAQAVIYGGVGQDAQARALARGVDILVATPGRLLDLMGQKLLSLSKLEVLVLDEADRMLDMGFIHDVRRILTALPQARQTLFFSATMPPPIAELAAQILRDPVRVAVAPPASTADRIEQSVYFVRRGDKRALLEHLLSDEEIRRVLVFTRTKHGANRLAKQLCQSRIGAEAIHGNKAQGARERALANFRSGATRVLVATDIAARGIDVDGISHVINFDLPNEAESYVHRIGRTARAGAAGIAYSFCDAEERPYLADVQRLIRRAIPVVSDHPYKDAVGSVEVPGPDSRGPRPERSGRPGRAGRPEQAGRDRRGAPQRHDGRGGRGERSRQARPARPERQDRPNGANGQNGHGRQDRPQQQAEPGAGSTPASPVGGAGMVALLRRLGDARRPGPRRR
jgi:ATP-dependent RNA helicase RhlE